MRSAKLTALVCTIILLCSTNGFCEEPSNGDLRLLGAAGDGLKLGQKVEPETPDRARLYFSFTTKYRSGSIDADVLSGGQLLMDVVEGKESFTLRLVKPIVHPYRFWWYNPWGPNNEDANCSTVLSICGEGPVRGREMERLMEAEEERARAFSSTPYGTWKRSPWKGDHEFDPKDDNTFFYVVGDGASRFNLTIDNGSGALSAVSNKMTDRWVADGYRAFRDRGATSGYGRWSKKGEAPFWETGAYKAFTALAKLLEKSPFHEWDPEKTARGGRGHRYTNRFWSIPQKICVASDALMQKAKGAFEGSVHPHVYFTVTAVSAKTLSVSGSSKDLKIDDGDGAKLRLSRSATYDREKGRIVSDRVEVRIWKDNGKLKLTTVIGYGPHAE